MTERPKAESDFLLGNFAPVRDERHDTDLEVWGTLPAELEGVFVRNGPNPQFDPLVDYHWFAGDGMLHAVSLAQGQASYRNRYIRTEGFLAENAEGRALWRGGLAMPEFDNPFGPGRGNTANTSLVHHHGKLWALWEAGPPTHMALPTLETLGLDTLGGALDFQFTAHPKVDPQTGELIFFGYDFIQAPFLRYAEISPEGELTHRAEIPLTEGAMIHDFGITEHFAVIPVFPYNFDFERAMAGENPFAFRAQNPTRFAVIPRKGTSDSVRWFEAPSCYAFHILNAYEDGDNIVIEGCRMAKISMDFGVDGEESASHPGRLHRWTLERTTGKVTELPLDDIGSDFPKINERYTGRKHQFGYCARVPDPSNKRQLDQLSDAWIKYDLAAGTSTTHVHGPDTYAGEGVFVPRAGATAEDDGWVIGFVHNRATQVSELHVVDAQRFDQPPVARVVCKRRVPYGFHGTWVPSAAIKA
ncbi:MAG: carotenoid oxygenase family protein [Deltaproteobacteria bacterium]|nr:carotenoid oxygenase family protein [Deltaproteobacteria bacterium]